MRKPIAAALGVALSLGVLETCCRLGVIPNARARARQFTARAGNSFKVLILGDSFIQDGGGLDGRLQDYCRRQGIVCLNLARPGMGPVDYLRMFQSYREDFRPDLVLLNYTVANDLTDTMRRASDEELRYWLNYRPPVAHAYLWEALVELSTRLSKWRMRRAARRAQAQGPPEQSIAANPYLALAARRHPEFLMTNLCVDSPAASRAWDINKAIFLSIREVSRSEHASLLIDVFPAAAQVDRSHDAFFKKIGFRLPPPGTPVPQDLFAAFCRQNSLSCNDLLPGFRRSRQASLYRENDDHWDDAGEDLAFRLIAAGLETATRRR
jgi:hypothetical protein